MQRKASTTAPHKHTQASHQRRARSTFAYYVQTRSSHKRTWAIHAPLLSPLRCRLALRPPASTEARRPFPLTASAAPAAAAAAVALLLLPGSLPAKLPGPSEPDERDDVADACARGGPAAAVPAVPLPAAPAAWRGDVVGQSVLLSPEGVVAWP